MAPQPQACDCRQLSDRPGISFQIILFLLKRVALRVCRDEFPAEGVCFRQMGNALFATENGADGQRGGNGREDRQGTKMRHARHPVCNLSGLLGVQSFEARLDGRGGDAHERTI